MYVCNQEYCHQLKKSAKWNGMETKTFANLGLLVNSSRTLKNADHILEMYSVRWP